MKFNLLSCPWVLVNQDGLIATQHTTEAEAQVNLDHWAATDETALKNCVIVQIEVVTA